MDEYSWHIIPRPEVNRFWKLQFMFYIFHCCLYNNNRYIQQYILMYSIMKCSQSSWRLGGLHFIFTFVSYFFKSFQISFTVCGKWFSTTLLTHWRVSTYRYWSVTFLTPSLAVVFMLFYLYCCTTIKECWVIFLYRTLYT
jgi:hypothetical protein